MSDFHKPSIVEVMEEYLPLRRAGREFKAPCPFHDDKTPSLYIDDEKGVFYCFGCGAKGDVIDFLMRWSGKSFREVCAHLGIQKHLPYVRIAPEPTEIYAKKIHEWILAFSPRVQDRLIEIGQRILLAKEANLPEEGKIAEREWTIMETLHEDIFNPEFALELYRNRKDLEGIVNDG